MSQTVFAESELGFVGCLAKWLTPNEPTFQAECVKMDEAGKVQDLSKKLCTKLAERLASGADAAEMLNAYAILFELLVTWQLFLAQAESLADELAGSKPESMPEAEQQLRCSLLLSLYGLVQQHGALDLRFGLLLRLIRFCHATAALGKVLGAVEGRVERAERWVSDWELSDAQQKQLWGAVFDAHATDSRVSYECALKYFALHEAKDLAALPELHDRIVRGLLITIRSPELFRCHELSQLSVVQQLESDAKFKLLHRLLQIMARETYAEFLAFASQPASKAFMSEHALPEAALAVKMRLLTLVSLGHGSKELTYQEVASALQVGVAEVETWVMQAIGSGLMTAKMDQVRETVAVSMCAERDFGKRQWEQLHSSLVEWRDSVTTLLDVLKTARVGA